MTVPSSATYRRRNDLDSPIPENDFLYDEGHFPVFASAINAEKNIQRRGKSVGRADTRNGGGGGLGLGPSVSDWSLFANGWKDDPSAPAPANVWEDGASASSSTSSLDQLSRLSGPSKRSLSNGLMSSPSHPLSSPSRPNGPGRWSHEDLGSPTDARGRLRRTNSDDTSSIRKGYRHNVGKGKGRMPEEELEVIVHEVCPTDSLPGVALKYGVELSDLRKANKLWASDSIHLRKTLFIPLHVRRFKSGVLLDLDEELENDDFISTEDPSGEARDAQPNNQDDGGDGSRTGSLRRTGDAPTIRRIPASKLSFFPPPTAPPPTDGAPQRTDALFERRGSLTSASSLSPQKHGTPWRRSPLPSLIQLSPPPILPSMNLISSSLRNIPALFAAKGHALSSPRLSASSDEVSEDPELELEDAVDWLSNPNSTLPAAWKQPGAGAVRNRRSKVRLRDIDWTGTDPTAADPISHSKNASTLDIGRVNSTSVPLEPISLKIQTQQPRPTPRMELPWSTGRPP